MSLNFCNESQYSYSNARAIAILAGYLRVDNTKMSLFSLGGVIFGDKLKFYDWMKSKGLLATRKECKYGKNKINADYYPICTY